MDDVAVRFAEHAAGRDLQLRLHGLDIIDLLKPIDSPHRKLATSYVGDSTDLVCVTYRETTAPAERTVDAALSSLHVVACRDSVAGLLSFFLAAPAKGKPIVVERTMPGFTALGVLSPKLHPSSPMTQRPRTPSTPVRPVPEAFLWAGRPRLLPGPCHATTVRVAVGPMLVT